MTDKGKDMIKAFIAAQKAMTAAIKSKENKHFHNAYADLASVQKACLPALNDNGFAVIQPIGQDENGAYVDTIFIHESGEQLSSRIYLVVDRKNMQGFGSACTYSRRYGLMGLAGIAPEDDDGNAAATAPPKDPPTTTIMKPKINHRAAAIDAMKGCADDASMRTVWHANRDLQADSDFLAAKDERKAELEKGTSK